MFGNSYILKRLKHLQQKASLESYKYEVTLQCSEFPTYSSEHPMCKERATYYKRGQGDQFFLVGIWTSCIRY